MTDTTKQTVVDDYLTQINSLCRPFLPQSVLGGKGEEWADDLLDDEPETARVLPLAVHPFIFGQPHRFPYFVKMLELVKNHPSVVTMTATEIYEWYMTETAK